MDEVLVFAKTQEELDQREQEMNERTNYGAPSDRVVTEDVSAADYKTVLELLRGKAGLRVDGSSVSIRGGSAVAFYLDGMEIDSTYIETLSASDISFFTSDLKGDYIIEIEGVTDLVFQYILFVILWYNSFA